MAITIDGTNGLTTDNAALKLDGTTLVVDDTNNRVGVGTASPAVAMDVVGQVRASTGILFGSDTAAANALDDYEEGTWTPVFNGSGGNPTVTYTLQYGYYTKIGRQVFVSGLVGISAFSGGSGNVSIAGLPFTVSNDDQNYPIGALGQMSGFTSAYGNVDGQVIALRPNQNTTKMNIQESYESASTDWSTTNIGASFTARFSASYFV